MKAGYSPIEIVNSGLCIGCGVCVALETYRSLRMHFNAYGELKPQGASKSLHHSSEEFSQICPFSPVAKDEDSLAWELFKNARFRDISIGHYISNFVGHVTHDDFRLQGSSGGMVSWVASELMRKGLIDGIVHVSATDHPQQEGKFFHYRISRNQKEIREGAKSRYYPVDLSDVLKIIRTVPGCYAVVGVPCMIKAVQLLRQHDTIYQERIRFTLGLFCGHMKSSHFAESIALQIGIPLHQVKEVDFRFKFPNRPANWYNTALKTNDGLMHHRDWWHLVDGDWGAGFFMNCACNYCDDVAAETADVSFGDAWVEPYSSDGKGNNVVVVRSAMIHEIILEGIKDGKLLLKEVDAEFVGRTQGAGLRQRREGLGYRLTWFFSGVKPLKRVKPDASLSETRKEIYRMRFVISRWSHRIFWLARLLRIPFIYLFWARLIASYYHGITYHQGDMKEMKKRFEELGR